MYVFRTNMCRALFLCDAICKGDMISKTGKMLLADNPFRGCECQDSSGVASCVCK